MMMTQRIAIVQTGPSLETMIIQMVAQLDRNQTDHLIQTDHLTQIDLVPPQIQTQIPDPRGPTDQPQDQLHQLSQMGQLRDPVFVKRTV